MNAVVTTVAEPTLTANAVVLLLTTTAAWCATRQQNARGRRGPSRRRGGPPAGPPCRTANKSGIGNGPVFQNPQKGTPHE